MVNLRKDYLSLLVFIQGSKIRSLCFDTPKTCQIEVIRVSDPHALQIWTQVLVLIVDHLDLFMREKLFLALLRVIHEIFKA